MVMLALNYLRPMRRRKRLRKRYICKGDACSHNPTDKIMTLYLLSVFLPRFLST